MTIVFLLVRPSTLFGYQTFGICFCIAYLCDGTLLDKPYRLPSYPMPFIFALSGVTLHRDRLNHMVIFLGCTNFFYSENFRRAPTLSFEFEKPLFEFAYERPHCDPLFALPPTIRSSMICCLFGNFFPHHAPVRKKKVE